MFGCGADFCSPVIKSLAFLVGPQEERGFMNIEFS